MDKNLKKFLESSDRFDKFFDKVLFKKDKNKEEKKEKPKEVYNIPVKSIKEENTSILQELENMLSNYKSDVDTSLEILVPKVDMFNFMRSNNQFEREDQNWDIDRVQRIIGPNWEVGFTTTMEGEEMVKFLPVI